MFVGDPPGNTDRILDFSTALTGAMFFTPTTDFLDDPPPLADSAPVQDEPPAVPVVSRDGSLGIGSLKGSS
jgi:putative iron-dependent peroxidase